MTTRLPWMKFCPRDWRADVALRSCSLAARGLWIELIGLMHDATPYGHLLVNGKAPDLRALAGMVGAGERETKAALQELEARGVFDHVDGVVVSRRMLRDHQARLDGQLAGRLGGNPALKRRRGPEDNSCPEVGGLTPPHNQISGPDPLPRPRASAGASESEAESEGTSLRSGRADRAAGPAEVAPDARTTLFREGLARLIRLTGKPDRASRGLLGRLLRDCGDDAALLTLILTEAESVRPGDPEAWIMGAIRHRRLGAKTTAGSKRSSQTLDWMTDPAAFEGMI